MMELVQTNDAYKKIFYEFPEPVSRTSSIYERYNYDSVMLSDDPNRAFCRLWTLRESYVKMRGLGFNIGLSTLKCDFHRGRAKMIEGGKEQDDAFFRELHGIPGYQASVCLKEERENTVHKIEI